jgi:site-specific DNA-methyltransferase (adenine-specific)
MKLVNDMMDKLPDEVWTNEKLKWFDPAAGMGNFPIAAYLRLMESLKDKISNDVKRKKHILENMLYMSELNKKNCYVIQQIFNMEKKYKLNLHCGDTLKMDIKKVFGIDKFDIIIGNPPYNKELTRVGALPLYNEFIEKFIDKCKYLEFIVPSRWFSGGKGLDKFRKFMLERKDIKFIKHFDDASKIFGKMVDIKGGVNYFLKDSKYNGECNFNGSMTQLNKYDVFVDSKFYNLIDKLTKYETITNMYISQDYYKVQTNDSRLQKEKCDGCILCYVSQQKGFTKYIDGKYIKKEYNCWKVITTRASFKASSGFGNTFIGRKSEIHCKTYISFNVKNELEAESLLSYLKCKLPNLMLSIRKNSQDISETTCKWIPLPPLDRIWINNDVYKYFRLNKDDIKLIENTKVVGYNDE